VATISEIRAKGVEIPLEVEFPTSYKYRTTRITSGSPIMCL
jgi:hypothetical protein